MPRIIARSMRMFVLTELSQKSIRLRQTAEAANRRQKEKVTVTPLYVHKTKKLSTITNLCLTAMGYCVILFCIKTYEKRRKLMRSIHGGKRVLALLLLCLTLLTVIGCSGQSSGTEQSSDKNSETEIKEGTSMTTEKETEAVLPKCTGVFAGTTNFDIFVKRNGRTFFSDRARAEYFNYSLSGFSFRFYGTGAEANLVSGLGNGTTDKNAILYVYVDDMTAPAKQITLNETSAWYVLAENLPEGEHTVTVSKRTDISYSSAGIKELRIQGSEAATLLEKPAAKERKIEFLGDSITSGDGVLATSGEGSYISQYQDAHYSYAKVTADYFGADCQLVSRCGLGLVWNSSQKAPEDGGVSLPMIYPYANYYDDSKRTAWNFDSFDADIIVINIGTNDRKQATASAEGKARWMETYVQFLKAVRVKNPDTPILCCYGSVIDDADLGLEAVVKQVTEEGMTDIYYLRFPKNNIREFGFGVGNHPTIKKQKYDAEEHLIPKIKEIMGW
ncbi:MAG: hypothetical protein E7618_03275 [Ruminococcaceae bacterium]|nr:hypothetical protein [Oscillospiraceae bacterium]